MNTTRNIIISILVLYGDILFADIERTWKVHKDVEISNTDITKWHEESTNRLNVDDDGIGTEDIACEVTIKAKSIERNWLYSNNSSQHISHSAELGKIVNSLTTHDSAVFSSYYNDFYGVNFGKKIIIFGDLDASVLAHEIGHVACNCDTHSYGENAIMRALSGKVDPKKRNRVSKKECEYLKALDVN